VRPGSEDKAEGVVPFFIDIILGVLSSGFEKDEIVAKPTS
jgi:hypothetical protein